MTVNFKGATFVITGASSGIGRALATQLASDAGVLVLVARRRERMEALTSELLRLHPNLEVQIEACDLAQAGEFAKLIDRLCAMQPPVDYLVNNAGTGIFGPFDQCDSERLEQMIAVNVTALVRLSRALLPGMVARGKGGILNLSSGWALSAAPGFAAYSASKSFVSLLTEGLRMDLRGTGVSVTHVCPGPVSTEFENSMELPSVVERLRFAYISPERCACDALRAFKRGRARVVPGNLAFRALVGSTRFVPLPLLRLLYAPFTSALRKRLP